MKITRTYVIREFVKDSVMAEYVHDSTEYICFKPVEGQELKIGQKVGVTVKILED